MYKYITIIFILFFIYNSCNGDEDICSLPLDRGSCTGSFVRYGYVEGQGCIEFSYGGCNGNENNFEFLSACKLACGD
ncbi:hemolymph trypsin inhibitor B-like [Achroia grisella]|uniref:hemolymph trypsin inhibitor B-like n=1 Tax=Achroia grisella TaxID=688607 RepID=UPI0027D32F52|nr:hemolymph trypsin inhibitor B-like [Achroia grisella]